jgi:predicted dehydrogenase
MNHPSAGTRIRVGVVGLGAVAQSVHLPLISRRWDLFELSAIADLSPTLLDSIGDQYGVPQSRRFLDIETMLAAGGLDGVLILTSGSHGAPAVQAIDAGVAVFCEKPLAYSRAEIDAIDEAERRAGRPMLLLAYMKEYDPAVLRMKERMPDLGDLRWAEVEVLHPDSPSQLAFANLRPAPSDIDRDRLAPLLQRDQDALDLAVGADVPASVRPLYYGAVVSSLIHDISALRALTGGIRTVDSARQWAAASDAGSIAIDGTITDDARFSIHWHFLPDYPAYHERITLHFLTGSLQVEFAAPYLLNAPTVLRIVSRDGVGERVEEVRDVSEAFEAELIAFHSMVVDGTEPPTGAAEGRADLITAQRIFCELVADRDVPIGGEALAVGGAALRF